MYSRSKYAYYGVTVKNTFSFANNATVKVKLGTHKVPRGTPVISWTEETKPANSVKFICADEGRSYRLVKKADGLYTYSGFVILIK